MLAVKTIILAAFALLSADAADTVTLFDSPGFQGQSLKINVSPWSCVNVGSSFNDRASSAWWSVPSGKGASIEFYEHNDCTGTARSWPVKENNYPNNFAIDGIDNIVSSIRMTGGWEN